MTLDDLPRPPAETFRSRGHCILPDLLDAAALASARAAAIALERTVTTADGAALARMAAQAGRDPDDFSFEAAAQDDGARTLRKLSGVQAYDPVLRDLPARVGLGGIAAGLLGAPRVRMLNAMLWWKSHRVVSRQPWHQDKFAAPPDFDSRYRGAVHVWVALTDVTTGNGCMWMVDRPAHGTMLPHVPSNDPRDGARLSIRLSAEERRSARPMQIAAGSAVAFDTLTPHATSENTSQAPRPVVSYFYVWER